MTIHIVTFFTKEYTTWAVELRESFKCLSELGLRFHMKTPDNMSGFFSKHKEEFLNFEKEPHLRKGYGNMFWKGKVINQVVQESEVGDTVIYLDADILLESKDKLMELIELKENLYFRVGECEEKNYTDKSWTKKEVINFFKTSWSLKEYKVNESAYQIMSGVQIYYISGHVTTKVICQELEYLLLKKELVSSEFDKTIQDPEFIEHRHDQSIRSVYINSESYRKYHEEPIILPDPTQFGMKEPVFKLRGLSGENLPKQLPKVSVITPVTSVKYLESIVKSVETQDYMNTELVLVVDHPDNFDEINSQLKELKKKYPFREILLLKLPFNTGRDNWNGHRIYAGVPHLLPNSDYFVFLDEDNTLEPEHISSLMSVVAKGNVWAYSLRNIIDQEGNFICQDNCESLGKLGDPWDNSPRLIDTGCYFLPREIAIQISYAWNLPARPTPGNLEVDRGIYKLLSNQVPKFECTSKYTLNYRVGNRSDSVKKEFFLRGNDEMAKRKLDDNSELVLKKQTSKQLDSSKRKIYLFHFTPDATKEFLERPEPSDRSFAFDNWEPNTISELRKRFDLINGYSSVSTIEPGSVVVVQICLPEFIPVEVLNRSDLIRIGYTVEGPNIRHQTQWDFDFLDSNFDYILTYFDPLLEATNLRSTRIFCPYLCRLNLNYEVDKSLLFENKVYDKSIVMVLENRPLSGSYTISGNTLYCLDRLRSVYASALPRVTVVGQGWEELARQGKVTLKTNQGKFKDTKRSIDYYRDSTFSLIIENCDGDGYVSEKIYDSFVAGCIPIYYGNITERMKKIIPSDTYIDAKNYKLEKLVKVISEIGIKEIIRYKKAILSKREEIIRKADATVYANLIENCIN